MKSSLSKAKIVVAALSLFAAFLSTEFTTAYGAMSGDGTATPIKHLVVIFQENTTFDHYFATDRKSVV